MDSGFGAFGNQNRYGNDSRTDATSNEVAAPPRNLSLLLRIGMLFGGFLNQFGWFFFGFGMIFFWAFALNTDPLAIYDFSGTLTEVPGKVVAVEKTSFSEGGSKNRPGTPIYQVDFNYVVGNETYLQTSYCKGKRTAAGKQVTVEFPEGRPMRSRIKGFRSAIVSSLALLVTLFPLIGAIFILVSFRFGWNVLGLMKHGKYTAGRLVRKDPTTTEINNRPVYKLTFDFEDEQGTTHQAVAKTHETQSLEDDMSEGLLYDPLNPARATLLDHLPGSLVVNSMGDFKTGSPVKAILCLIVPVLSVVGHSIAFYYLFLK